MPLLLAFMWKLGIQTQAITAVQQTLLPTEPSPSLSFLFYDDTEALTYGDGCATLSVLHSEVIHVI